MASTSSKVRVPAGSDAFDPQGDMVALGQSLDGMVIVQVANITERTTVAAAVAPSTTKPLYVHRMDAGVGRELEVSTNGTDWRTLPTAGVGPYAMAVGQITLATDGDAQGPQVVVNLPAGRFTTTPAIFLTAQHSVMWGYEPRVYAKSTSQFTCGVVAKNVAPFSTESGTYMWMAVQMAAASTSG